MNLQFSNVVDAAYKLPLADREELKNLLEHNIQEARREEIAATMQAAKAEEKNKKLKFGDNIADLKKMLK
jgi:hypothetical protein